MAKTMVNAVALSEGNGLKCAISISIAAGNDILSKLGNYVTHIYFFGTRTMADHVAYDFNQRYREEGIYGNPDTSTPYC